MFPVYDESEVRNLKPLKDSKKTKLTLWKGHGTEGGGVQLVQASSTQNQQRCIGAPGARDSLIAPNIQLRTWESQVV